jgi:hypothetical protein
MNGVTTQVTRLTGLVSFLYRQFTPFTAKDAVKTRAKILHFWPTRTPNIITFTASHPTFPSAVSLAEKFHLPAHRLAVETEWRGILPIV